MINVTDNLRVLFFICKQNMVITDYVLDIGILKREKHYMGRRAMGTEVQGGRRRWLDRVRDDIKEKLTFMFKYSDNDPDPTGCCIVSI